MSRTSKRYTSQCITPPPADVSATGGDPLSCGPTSVNCNDPAYAAAHPDQCGGGPTGTGGDLVLVLKPGVAQALIGNVVQYATAVSVSGVENPVTAAVTYTSSNPSVATIDPDTGLATGIADGVVTITSMWHGLVAFAQLTVVAVCINTATSYCIVVDNSNSMSQPFNDSYASKFSFAIAAARVFAAGIDYTRDNATVGYFNQDGLRVLTRSTSLDEVNAALDSLHQTDANTSLYEGLRLASEALAESDAERKVALFITDGEDRPTPEEVGNSVADKLTELRANSTLIEVVGVRAYGAGYVLLNSMATPGFFLNAYDATAADTLTDIATFVNYGTCSDYNLSTPPAPQSPDPVPSEEVETTDTTGGPGGGGPGGGPGPNTFTVTASYTAVCPGSDVGDPVTRSATYTSNVSIADAQLHADQAARQAAYADLVCCTNSVVINDFDTATPYPSCYKIAGFVGTVTSIGVVIQNFTHPAPADVAFLLVGPQGQSSLLMGGCGSKVDAANSLTLTFVTGGTSVPSSGALTTTDYAPTHCGAATPNFPAPGPGPFDTADLTVFNGEDPNGLWHLYVIDNVGLDAGSIDSWFVVVNGEAGCVKTMAAGSVRIHNFNTVGPTLGSCSNCTANTGLTVWDGVFTPTPGQYYSSYNFLDNPGVALNGRSFCDAYIRYVPFTGGVCFWELSIRCLNPTVLTHPGQNPFYIIWTGRKSAAFGSSPVGNYDRVSTTVGVGTPAPCSVTPTVIQIEDVT